MLYRLRLTNAIPAYTSFFFFLACTSESPVPIDPNPANTLRVLTCASLSAAGPVPLARQSTISAVGEVKRESMVYSS